MKTTTLANHIARTAPYPTVLDGKWRLYRQSALTAEFLAIDAEQNICTPPHCTIRKLTEEIGEERVTRAVK